MVVVVVMVVVGWPLRICGITSWNVGITYTPRWGGVPRMRSLYCSWATGQELLTVQSCIRVKVLAVLFLLSCVRSYDVWEGWSMDQTTRTG